VGRKPNAVTELVALAETLSIPVVVMLPRYMNFPSAHPLHVGYDPHPYLLDADVIVALESDVPWYPQRAKPQLSAKIIHIAEDPIFSRYPIRGFPSDVAVCCDPAIALSHLRAGVKEVLDRESRLNAIVAERRTRIQSVHNLLKERAQAEIDMSRTKVAIDERWLSHCVGRLVDPNTILVNEYDLIPDFVDFTVPGSLFMISPAGGLGWGLGAAIGAKLAAPGKCVIAVVGDGSYMFGGPLACHFVSAKYLIPFLTVVCNNGRWNAVRKANQAMYPTGWAERSGVFPFSDLLPSPGFERVVESCGGYGARVETPAELPDALSKALDVVHSGRQAVVNVLVSGEA
jgi:acetolactate synthase-1/2/3 large subunit